MFVLVALLQVIGLASAFPIVDSDGLTYHSHKARQANLPVLKLPYGDYQATKYDEKSDIYTFQNIRFAAPPVGQLRFAKPAPPAKLSGIQTGKDGHTCYMSIAPSMLQIATGGALGSAPIPMPEGMPNISLPNIPLISDAIKGLQDQLGGAVGGQLAKPETLVQLSKTLSGLTTNIDVGMGEDCLFLDVYVPGKALKGQVKLPVVNWIYGGAYILGSKDGMGIPTPIVKQSGGNVILVAGNYRLGAFGFLGGASVERDATPNAAFWDQRAVLDWIKDNIHLVGGDPQEVTVWGESAGAGSIYNHLVAFGGKQPALFKRAIMQSIANDVQWDRKGILEENFQKFAAKAGCAGQGIACMRAKDGKVIKTANDEFIIDLFPGAGFGFGPVADGTLIRQAPDLELASGNFQKDIESVIVTHVADEGQLFAQETNNTAFEAMLVHTFGDNKPINDAMVQRFPAPNAPSAGGQAKYATGKERENDFSTLATFNVHAHAVADAFKGKVHMARFARGKGWHAFDLIANSYESGTVASDPGFGEFATAYRGYLLSYAMTGDPNTSAAKYGNHTIQWPLATPGSPSYTNVLNAGDKGFELITDSTITEKDADMFVDAWATVTKQGGYTPADGAVQSKFG